MSSARLTCSGLRCARPDTLTSPPTEVALHHHPQSRTVWAQAECVALVRARRWSRQRSSSNRARRRPIHLPAADATAVHDARMLTVWRFTSSHYALVYITNVLPTTHCARCTYAATPARAFPRPFPRDRRLRDQAHVTVLAATSRFDQLRARRLASASDFPLLWRAAASKVSPPPVPWRRGRCLLRCERTRPLRQRAVRRRFRARRPGRMRARERVPGHLGLVHTRPAYFLTHIARLDSVKMDHMTCEPSGLPAETHSERSTQTETSRPGTAARSSTAPAPGKAAFDKLASASERRTGS